MRVRNFSRWTMHMDGLLRILDSFGGIGNLPSSQELQLALFWYSLRSFDL